VKLKPRWIFASIFLAAGLFQPVANPAPNDGSTPRMLNGDQITIRVHDYAEIKSKVLLQAERSAGDILRESGIDTHWVVCRVDETPSGDAACTRSMTSLDLILNLLPRPMAQRSNFRDDVFGVAMESAEKGFGFYASIFYDNVKDCAAHEHFDLAPLLGHVIAHELGHLLLGTNSHSTTGLMSAFWTRKQLAVVQQRGLALSFADSEHLQRAVRARRLAALLATEGSESASTLPLAARLAR
jgi:hypothetical protein